MPKPLINDLPEEDRPREKLTKWGPQALSNAELIAIFLRVGVTGKSAIEVAQELLDTHGSLRSLGRANVKEIAKQHGVGPAKAAQISAAFELGLRSAKEEMNKASVASPKEIYTLMSPILSHQSCEKVFLLLVDTRLKHERTIELSHGSVTESICHPRDVLHHALLHQSYGFILIHNHPSGDASPSEADKRMTQAIREAAELMQLRFIDHLIIGSPNNHRDAYYSFREHGFFN
ncbi:DNA repair protein RadC [Rubritalea spongiae]|uniref:DNA repair protein RadC n=1 Tax=Rubritalea spongiae TaxID=430797 RepID=A0ABW5DZZ7_9BACT